MWCANPLKWTKLGLPTRSKTGHGGRVEVVVHDGVNRMVPNVRCFEDETPWKRMLDRKVPRLHIRVFEILIHHKKGALYERRDVRRNNAVCWNYRLNEIWEAILESCRLSAGE